MQTKYIFITGGVVSGLGKGITAASVGLILKSAGYSVDVIKFDPYLNVDPGTMSPFEHGEVYVLADGTETDLDLGHYERFLDTSLSNYSSVTAGKVYTTILQKERQGEFLGKNVQLIPNVTDSIKEYFVKQAHTDFRIIEIGGSSGDMEAEIFLESCRQFKLQNLYPSLHIHLGYIPFLECSGEFKTKPIQSSIKELLRLGLQPNIIVARYAPKKNIEKSEEIHLETSQLDKIALFSNLKTKNVIPLPDLDSIYKVPGYLQSTSLVENIFQYFNLKHSESKLPEFFNSIFSKNINFKDTLKIALISKYSKLNDAYLSILESLKIACYHQKVNLEYEFIEGQFLENLTDSEIINIISKFSGVLVPGGFGSRGIEGKIKAIKAARTLKIPFLGICLGLQLAVIEIARNAGLRASTAEIYDNPETSQNVDFVIDYMDGQKDKAKGGSMRLGNYKCSLVENTLAKKLFGKTEITERHRHRLEVQNQYLEILNKAGLIVSGKHYKDFETDNFLVEIIELDTKIHPFFIATQSHPEFLSRPNAPHPMFAGFVKAAKNLLTTL